MHENECENVNERNKAMAKNKNEPGELSLTNDSTRKTELYAVSSRMSSKTTRTINERATMLISVNIHSF